MSNDWCDVEPKLTGSTVKVFFRPEHPVSQFPRKGEGPSRALATPSLVIFLISAATKPTRTGKPGASRIKDLSGYRLSTGCC